MSENPSRNIKAIDALFDQLLDLEAAARERRMAELRASDPALAGEIERLLSRCSEESPGFEPGGALDGDIARECLLELGGDAAALQPGASIGPYLIERIIGKGGMSEVYLATRRFEGFSQPVALKLVRHDRVGEALSERLLAEQRTLARLGHPNIARFLDAGAGPQGNVFLAMELVEGAPILEHARAARAGLRERVGWVIALCGALEHAHAQLVVHCDIKPSNVLVDRRGQARLLDFGIARVLGEGTQDPSSLDLKLFTPHSAAPEQITGAPVTTATDIFQIGALLYQLIVGRPWSGEREDPAGYLEAILHEAPVPPGRRIREGANDTAIRINAESCGGSTRAVARQVDGDLDAVVLKCLAKDPARRYTSIEQVRHDLEAWLESRPVAAARPSRPARARLWLRRNRRTVGVAAAGLGALAIVATISIDRIAGERAEKARELERAQAVEGFMGQVFRQASPYLRDDQENALDTLVRVGDSMLASDRGMDPRTHFSLMAVLANLEMDMGHPERAESRARAALAAADAGNVDDDATRLGIGRLLADALSRQDRDSEAIDVLHAALERIGSAGLPATELAKSRAQLGELYETVGRLDEATQQFDVVYDTLVVRDGPLDSGSVEALRRLGRYLYVGQEGENPAKVKAIANRLSVEVPGETSIQRAARLSTLSLVTSLAADDPAQSGRYGRDAARVLASALGDGHPRVSIAWSDACIALLSGGELLEAKAACEAALEANVVGKREDSISAAADRLNLGTIEYLRGNFASAGTIARDAMAKVDKEAALALYMYGAGLQAQADYRSGNHAAALALLEDMAAIHQEHYPDNADQRLSVHSLRAQVLLAQGRPAEAAGALEAAGIRTATGGPVDRINAAHMLVLAAHQAATGQMGAAAAQVADGIRAFESHPAMSPAELSWGLLGGGEVLLQAGEHDGAAGLFARALDTGLDPVGMPGMWAWAVLRREQLEPGSFDADALARAGTIAREQFGSNAHRVPCLALVSTPADAPTACP